MMPETCPMCPVCGFIAFLPHELPDCVRNAIQIAIENKAEIEKLRRTINQIQIHNI